MQKFQKEVYRHSFRVAYLAKPVTINTVEAIGALLVENQRGVAHIGSTGESHARGAITDWHRTHDTRSFTFSLLGL